MQFPPPFLFKEMDEIKVHYLTLVFKPQIRSCDEKHHLQYYSCLLSVQMNFAWVLLPFCGPFIEDN